MRGVGAILVAVVFLLSGCTGAKAKDEPQETAKPSSVIAEASPADETGIIRGVVVTDEARPILGAQVGISELNLEVETGETGGFEFVNVAIGKYRLFTTKLGYEVDSRAVEVATGETTQLQITLLPIEVTEAHYVATPHNYFHHHGQADVDYALNLTGAGPGCEACVWIVPAARDPTAIYIEINGVHTVPNPALAAGEYVYVMNHDGGAALRGHQNYNLPVKIDQTENLKKLRALRLTAYCDITWFCYEEKRESWTTMFYDMERPDDYSAFPPA